MKYKECTIKGFEGLYRIYENGDIYSYRKKRILKPNLNSFIYSKYSYLYICLTGLNGEYLRTGIHRIVAHHFIKPILNKNFYENGSKLEVNHIDKCKLNNHYTNLELVTHQQNMLHARNNTPNWSTGTKKGFKHTKVTREKMAKKKMKKVVLFNDNEHIIYNSIAELCEKQNIYRKKFDRAYSKNSTINGYNIRHLTK